MNALASLKISLSGFGDMALKGGFTPPDELRRYTQALEKRFGAADSDKPRLDRMEPALRKLLISSVIETPQDLRYICYGLAYPVGPSKQRVLSSLDGFSALKIRINSVSSDTKRLRRCYQGLLASYFEFDGKIADDLTKKQWYEVRDMLDGALNAIMSIAPVPKWVAALHDHRNLLSDAPCKRYSTDLLNGKGDELDFILDALGISDKSWVLRESALSAIQAACEDSDDSVFQSHIPDLLALMTKHPLIQKEALAKIMKRYVEIESQPENMRLCDFSVELWGNPLLKKNLRNWDVVGEAVTKLVSGWLKSSLIQDFFELLSVDGKTDKRRVTFWKRYIESIDDMFFAMGRNAYYRNDDEDIKRLRKTMGDNLLLLDGGGASNGFFMVMGNKVVAEFGEMGNAVYIFRHDSMPFELKGRINGTGRKEWRELNGAHYLSHQDNIHHYLKWESRFESYFKNNLGILPGKAPEHKSHATVKSGHYSKEEMVDFSSFQEIQKARAQAPLPADIDSIRKFCLRYGMKLETDTTRRLIIVRTASSSPLVTEYLTAQAFTNSSADACWMRSY